MPKSKNSLIGALMVVALVGGVMVGAYVLTTPDAQKVRPDLRRPRAERSSATKTERHTLRPTMRGDRVTYVPEPAPVPQGADPRVHLVNEFLRRTKGVSKDARLLGVDVRDGIAFLDFNPAFASGYGSEDEAIVVNGILAVLSQFPEIKKAKFQIEGEPMESLGGHLDLENPQPVRPLNEQNEPQTDG